MKTIAFTNSFYKNFTGSELAVFDAAKFFLKQGYKVYIFTFNKGKPLMSKIPDGIKVINILTEKIPKLNVDILWGQHWAVMTKLLSDSNFTAKKIIHFSLSPYHFYEREPEYAKLLSGCFGNSWETASVRMQENPGLNIGIFNNSVTPDFFETIAKPGSNLKRLAIVGNNKVFSPDGDFVNNLRANGIEVEVFGFGGTQQILTPDNLVNFDAIFTIGRTVQYALSLGIPVFCYDRFGGPGYINTSNWQECEKMNYSGRTHLCNEEDLEKTIIKNHDIKKLTNDLINNYSKTLIDLPDLQKIAKERYDLFANIEYILQELPDSEISYKDIECEIDNANKIIKDYFMQQPKKSVLFKIKREIKRIFKQISGLFKKVNNKNPKFGVSFCVYDGEELLERSVECIRPVANYINIVCSEKSYFGESGNYGVKELCESLKQRGLVDEIIYYETTPPVSKNDPDFRKKRAKAELEQRQAGLNAAKIAGCNYFMTMDTDEFYDALALQSAKQKIINNPKWTHTFVHILNYGKAPTKRYDGRKWEYFVPFFAKIDKNSKMDWNKNVPCVVTSMRNIAHCRDAQYWILDDIFMHHFTRVRKKLDDKYTIRNVSADVDKDWINKEENFITVPDYFGLKDIF